MRNKSTLLAIALLGVLYGTAQSPHSSSTNSYQNQAASLLLSGEYQAAIKTLHAAAKLYKESKDWHSYFSCLNQITKAYLSLEDYDGAKVMAKKVLWESIEEMGRNNDESAKAAHQLAEVYSQARRYSKAEEFHSMGLKIRRAIYGNEHPAIASSYSWLALNEERQGHYRTAMDQYTEALAMRSQLLGEQHAEVATSLENIGRVLAMQDENEKAIKEYEKALEIKKQALGSEHIKTAQLLSKIGTLYKNLERSNKAETYHQQAAAIYMQPESEASLSTAEGLLLYGKILFDASAYQKAIPVLEKSCNILKKYTYRGLAYEMYGITLYHMHHYAKAAEQLQYSWSIGNRTASCSRYMVNIQLANEHPDLAVEWADRYLSRATTAEERAHAHLLSGLSLLANDKAAEALKEIQYAIPRLTDSPFLMKAYLAESNALIALNQIDVAFRQMDKAIDSPDNDLISLEQLFLFEINIKKARTLTYLARQDRKKIANLQAARKQYEQCESMLNEMLNYSFTEYHLERLQHLKSLVFDGLIQNSYDLFSQTQQTNLIHEALEYTEKNKDFRLVLIQRQQMLKNNEELFSASLKIHSLEKKLATNYFSGQNIDDTSIQIHHIKEAYQALLPESIEANGLYTATNFLRFQDELLESEKTALVYHYGNKALYTFLIDGQSIELSRDNLSKGVENKIQRFIGICEKDPYLLSADELAISFKEFTSLSENLRRMLLPPITYYYKASSEKELLLIPDGPLINFPFEAISIDSVTPSNFGNSNYLGQHAKTSYHYSIRAYNETSLLNMPHKVNGVFLEPNTYPGRLASNNDKIEKPSDMNRLLFYDLATSWVNKTGGKLYQAHEDLADAKNIDGDVYFMTSVAYNFPDISLFRRNTEQLYIIAKANPATKLLSMSNHCLINRWETNNKESNLVLDKFLTILFDKQSAPFAIRKAREQYLKANIHQPLQAHPFFWAGYHFWGKSATFQSSQPLFSKYWILIAISGVILLGWWVRKR